MTTPVARLTEADWEAFAGVRLRALADAFGDDDAQYRREATFTEADWRRRLREHASFAVWQSGRPVGVVAAHRESVDTVYLYSLWLAPEARGRGLAADLVSAVLAWAKGLRVRTVYLRVATGNAGARALYEGLGFAESPAAFAPADELAMSVTVL